MKITGNDQPQKVQDLSAGQTRAKEKTGEARTGQTKEPDALLNRESLTVNRVKDAIRAEPEVRAEKVAELKAKIKNGDHKVDSHKLAENMLTSALREDIEKP
ncbi:MAG: flagellar biosynthesis anti-sigma factor FlgM [Deltaproteobacteria bacterium]|nr:flagellar biosynthesis anti-sigma factor FlgM [Deltaproteobacteria bacterium]